MQVANRSIKAKAGFLARFKSRWENFPIESIGLTTVDKYKKDRKRQGVKNATINRETSALRHLFTWAQSREIIKENPRLRLGRLEEPQWIGETPTPEAVKAVFDKLDERFLPVFTLIRETGARRGEVLNLTRDRVDQDHRMVTFINTKNGKARHVFLTDEALAAIDAVPPMPGCPYVFYNPETGDRWYDARKPWEAARKAAGYRWLRVEDLRIAMGTELAEAGLPLEMISKLLGNTRAVAEKYYAKVAPESAPRRALQALMGGRKK